MLGFLLVRCSGSGRVLRLLAYLERLDVAADYPLRELGTSLPV